MKTNIVNTYILLLLMSSWPARSKPQSSLFGEKPFRLKTNFLQEFMKMSETLFPFSSSTSRTSKNLPRPPMSNTASSNSVLVKRRISEVNLGLAAPQSITKGSDSKTRKSSSESLSEQLALLRLDSGTRTQMRHIARRTKERTKPKKSSSQLEALKSSSIETISTNSPPTVRESSSTSTTTVTPYPKSNSTSSQPEKKEEGTSFLGLFVGTLTKMPIIGNLLRATVDPLYRPLMNRIQSRNELDNETLAEALKDWCFGELGCLHPSGDFFHPLYRPVNLPPYSRKDINVLFTIHTREDKTGAPVPWDNLEDVRNSTFSPNRKTKFVIHGFLHNRRQTWVMDLIRGFLHHGDYNVITVDWSRGSHALYSQATANTRLVALEIANLIFWLQKNYKVEPFQIHLVGHSLGAHTAGYVGEKIKGLDRITGLDPAEPYFQYMPESVRLDPSDAYLVDVIHTDMDSFFAITGPRGFGLQQPVGHVDFYPNGGHEQPGCNSLLTRVPLTLITEGEDFGEGINAAQTELVQCDHIRAPKLFTDSLISNCPYLGFACESYDEYKKGNCFDCGSEGEKCVSMGINADQWNAGNNTNLKVFLDTHISPNFCMYHYLLTIDFADPFFTTGQLRGRLQVTLITDAGELKKFDLTALSPHKFPRRGSRTFMLEHYEDLSATKEALLSWTFESDLLNPLTFCVIFCRADLSVASVSFISVDTARVAERVAEMGQDAHRKDTDPQTLQNEILMCQPKGESAMIIPNGGTVKVSFSPDCEEVREKAIQVANIDAESDKIHHVELTR